MKRITILLLFSIFLISLAEEMSENLLSLPAEPFIQGGIVAKKGDIPYTAVITYYLCQGAILNEYTMIMEGSCVARCLKLKCQAMVALTDLGSMNGIRVNVTKVILHPSDSIDIGLVHTTQIPYSIDSLAIRLPTKDLGGYKTDVIISGWNGTQQGVTNALRYAKTEAFLCNSPDDDFACIVDGPYPCGIEDGAPMVDMATNELVGVSIMKYGPQCSAGEAKR